MDFCSKPHLALLTAFLLSATAFASSASADIIIYEGFEYAPGAGIVGQSGGIGFDGSYTGASNTTNVSAGPGLSFGALEVAGGSVQRTNRAGRGAISRTISAESQAAFADGETVYFSLLLDPTVVTTDPGINGFANATFGTLTIGNAGQIDGGFSGASPPVIAGAGDGSNSDALGVGFFGGANAADFPAVGIQGVSFDNGAFSQVAGPATGDVLSFVVGRLELNAAGTDDVLTLFNVGATDTALGTSFATISADLDNASFDTISISDAQTSGFDEIRFGTTLESVTPGLLTAVPEPSSLMILGFSGVALLVRRRR